MTTLTLSDSAEPNVHRPVETPSRQVTLADYLRFEDPTLSALYLRNLHVCSWFPAELDAMHCPEVRHVTHWEYWVGDDGPACLP